MLIGKICALSWVLEDSGSGEMGFITSLKIGGASKKPLATTYRIGLAPQEIQSELVNLTCVRGFRLRFFGVF
jgi:hypothetical protein